MITLRGHATGTITRHEAGGPVTLHESGSFTVVWRVPESELGVGRHFMSSSVVVNGTTSALFEKSSARSCRGLLAARSAPFELTVAAHSGGNTAFLASPNPFATATSAACPLGLSASRWRLALPPPGSSQQQKRRYSARKTAWWFYNHPGFGFTGEDFSPAPQGGNGEGFGLGFGPAGSFRWTAFLTVRPL
jgi:hypothetical protein